MLSNIFSTISLVYITIISIPQAAINYQLQGIHDLSAGAMIAYILCGEAVAVCLIWSLDLMIISVAFTLFVSISFFIGCQIRYPERHKEHCYPTTVTSEYSLVEECLQLSRYCIQLLAWSLMNGIAQYYLFVLTKSHIWIPRLIGIIILSVLDLTSLNSQHFVIIRAKLPIKYSVKFNIIKGIISILCLIAICLQPTIDIVSLISLILLVILQILLVVLKVCAFQRNSASMNKTPPREQIDSKIFGKHL
jgi:hypothetical protein